MRLNVATPEVLGGELLILSHSQFNLSSSDHKIRMANAREKNIWPKSVLNFKIQLERYIKTISTSEPFPECAGADSEKYWIVVAAVVCWTADEINCVVKKPTKWTSDRNDRVRLSTWLLSVRKQTQQCVRMLAHRRRLKVAKFSTTCLEVVSTKTCVSCVHSTHFVRPSWIWNISASFKNSTVLYRFGTYVHFSYLSWLVPSKRSSL